MLRRKKKSQLLDDVMKVMCLEVGQAVHGHDVNQIYRTVSKWDTLFRELIAPLTNGKHK